MKKHFIFTGITFLSFLLFFSASVLKAEETGEKGRIETQSFRYGADGKLLGYAVHDYNQDLKKTETRWYNDQGRELGSTKFEYNDAGRLFKEWYYSQPGEVLISYTVYEYNKDGLKRKSSSYFKDGDLHSSVEYIYDDEGRLAEERSYDKNDSFQYKAVSLYDQSGRKTESRVLKPGGSDETLDSYAEYEYDSQGFEIKMSVYDAKGTLLWYIKRKWQNAE